MFESKLEGCTKTETFKHLAILVQLQVEIASAPPAPRPLQRSGWWLGFVGTVQHYQCSKEITLRKFTVFNCLTIIFYMNDMSLFSMSVRFCLDVYILLPDFQRWCRLTWSQKKECANCLWVMNLWFLFCGKLLISGLFLEGKEAAIHPENLT